VTDGRRRVLCVLVDALRHDYLEPARTPVLAELASRCSLARMRPVLGYSDSIRATIFTGAYPDEHGYWMEYCYRPGEAPFAPLRRLAPLDRLPSDFVRRGLKFVLSKTIVRSLGRRGGYRHLSLRHLPFRALGKFDWTLRGGMTDPGAFALPTFFDELTAAGRTWAYLDSSVLGRRLLHSVDALPADLDVAFVYLHQIDMASHVWGIDSPRFERALRRTDALAGEVIRRFGDADLVVFSDHGMSPVDRIVSFPGLWRHPAFPEGFCFALDATMVRLWFEDEDEALRQEIRDHVAARAPQGRWLGRDELATLHLDFRSRLYGDEIYLLEPRTAIFPNFHSLLRPKAMHAYHPDDLEQHGILIAPRGEVEAEVAELVEVAPLVRRLAGLPQPAAAPPRSDRPRAAGTA
jgi:hypothetical protein